MVINLKTPPMKPINQKEIHLPLSLAVVLALLFIFILPLVTCPLKGQVVQKKQLDFKDFNSLGELQLHKATPDTRWSSFSMHYKNGIDTLFLRSTSNKKEYFFPSGTNPDFLANTNFLYQKNAALHLVNLHTGAKQTIEHVLSYACSISFGQLIVLTKQNSPARKTLLILNKDGVIIQRIARAEQFKISPCSRKVVFTTMENGSYSLGIIELTNPITPHWILRKSSYSFKMLTWEKTARALCFIGSEASGSNKNSLFYYITKSKALFCMDPEKQIGFPPGHLLDSLGQYPLNISQDLKRVFFGLLKKTDPDPSFKKSNFGPEVELWNGNDKLIYPMQQRMGDFNKKTYLAVWTPFKEELAQISNQALPGVMLAGEQQYAVLSNPQSYEPQLEYSGPRDFYILDLNTGKKEVLLQNKAITPTEPMPGSSPGGKYITYSKQNDCWIYDLKSKTHLNITQSLRASLPDSLRDLHQDSYFRVAGWTPYDKQILLYDTYDIWIITPDGNSYRRITHGREKKIHFRIFESPLSDDLSNYEGWTHRTFNADKGLLLEAKGDDGKAGYFKWEAAIGEKPIVYKEAYTSELFVSQDQKSFIYREEQFNISPRIVLQKGKTSHVFFQSNPHQAQYNWGQSTLIAYQNLKGSKLQALLYYPVNYDPKKKYPMIVNVYEKQSSERYKYINPTLENEAGYNPTVLTNQGYFVLCPDIVSEKQNEGPSALDCTVAATKEIIARGLVYPDKIGIIGHSFGGFETCYIITHTSLYAAAVAGAAITDISSYYYTINWDTGRPTMNYFQSGQLKMERPPYEIPDIYDRNSPIVHAPKVTTPLLSYAGKKDNHVDWHQSVEFYLALRILGKKNVMLLYPQEAHTILDPQSQTDLTQRISQWFAYYLKDEKHADWIEKGTM